jgi:hypothetical protein
MCVGVWNYLPHSMIGFWNCSYSANSTIIKNAIILDKWVHKTKDEDKQKQNKIKPQHNQEN